MNTSSHIVDGRSTGSAEVATGQCNVACETVHCVHIGDIRQTHVKGEGMY